MKINGKAWESMEKHGIQWKGLKSIEKHGT